MLSQKEKYQDEKVVSVTKALRAMFIKESDLSRKLKEGYVNDHLAKHYFDKLRQKHKMRSISLKNGMFKWKQSWVYVSTGKLHTKILKEVHNVPMVRHWDEKTTHMKLGKSFY